jgi:tetratricopeptide (TPR) repeat protein
MESWTMRGVRRGLVLLATGTIAGAAWAQQPARVPSGAVVQPMGRDDGAELRRHLTTLADNPRSLDALIGAGRAALRSGDAEAALSFFARADEISPRHARVKAGMASSLVHLGRAQGSLGYFQQALALGAPVGEIAGDRGLAFDMLGDPRRAQQDYTLALRYRDDDEIRRRMALSLAISGEREAALRLIDPQLRRNERAGWRTQAFVLALTGDAGGATRTAQGSMPPGAAQAMAPFLARLASLSPAQKAQAVHLGHFPSTGRSAAMANSNVAADPGALALAMGGAPSATRQVAAAEEPARTGNRRRPGAREAAAAARRRQEPGGGGRRVASIQDSGDRYGLRGRTATRRRDRSDELAPPVERGETEVAQVNTRWAGAPVIQPASPPTAQQQQQQTTPQQTPRQTPQAAARAIQPTEARQAPAVSEAPPAALARPQPGQTAPPRNDTQSREPPQATAAEAQSGESQAPAASQRQLTPSAPPPSAPDEAVQQPGASSAADPPADQAAQPGLQVTSLSPPEAMSLGPANRPSTTIDATGSLALPSPPGPSGAASPAAVGPAASAAPDATPGFTLAQPGASGDEPISAREGLSDIASLVNSLPPEEASDRAAAITRAPEPPAEPAGAAPTRTRPPERPTPARTPAATRPATARTPAAAHPSRHWVQVAGGANRAGLPAELARLRTKAPELAGRTAWTTPLNATNRLLVGPFPSAREAQEFVNRLAQRDVAAFAWTSPAGQEIHRLTGR